MQSWIMEIMNTYGYLGIALLITIENVFPPIPSEVILTFGGFMTTYTKMNILGVVLSSTVGSVFGAIILSEVGSLVSQERLEKILSGRLGHLLHFKQEDVGKAIRWFDSQGNYTVLFCRCIPIVRSLISIPAGMAKMPLPTFLFLTTVGSTIWNLLLVTLGAMAGASWQRVVLYMNTYSDVAVAVTVGGLLLGLFVVYRKRKKK